MTNSRETDMQLSRMAARLKLSLMRDNMAEMLETAVQAKMTPRETLVYFLSKELDRREANRTKLALMGAHFPRVSTLEQFDMSAQPNLDAGLIRELAKTEWVNAAENVLLLGPPGVGKTHLAIAFGRCAIQHNQSVLFTSAATLSATLEKAHREGNINEKLAALAKPKLLIIDELGYLPLRPETSHMFFQLICRRYETKSVLITSNRSVNDWGQVFGDPTVATAILDRLLHHCTPITINGESYRMREAVKANVFGRTKTKLLREEQPEQLTN